MRPVLALLALGMLALAVCLTTVNAEPSADETDVTSLASAGDVCLDAMVPELPALRRVTLVVPAYAPHHPSPGRLAPSEIFEPPRV